jgi:RimJ/RimL family protein N-acetyltransferase
MMRTRRIRGPADRAAVEAIDRTLFPKRDGYALEIEPETIGWLLVDPDRTIPVGFLVLDDLDGDLERFGILTAARGRGGSFLLLRALDRHARRHGWTRIETYTAPDNVESMRALIRGGWLPVDFEIEADHSEWLLWEKRYA